MKRCFFPILFLFLIICISSCGQPASTESTPGGFPDHEIIESMGIPYDDFMKRNNLSESNDTLLLTKNNTKTTINNKLVDDEIIEFAEKKNQIYFNHEFKPFYSFSSNLGLTITRFYGSIEKESDALIILKQISDSFSNQYPVSPTYSVVSEQRIIDFFKKDQKSQQNILKQIHSSSVSLSDQWVIQESLPDDPDRRLVVEVSYSWGTDAQTNTQRALITVSYVCERKNLNAVSEKLGF